jgi:hypothetical protein
VILLAEFMMAKSLVNGRGKPPRLPSVALEGTTAMAARAVPPCCSAIDGEWTVNGDLLVRSSEWVTFRPQGSGKVNAPATGSFDMLDVHKMIAPA